LLSYKSHYLKTSGELKNRLNQKRNEIELVDEILVYVRNQLIPTDFGEIYFNKTNDFVMIPLQPIVKAIEIGGMDFPLSLESYVQVPISFAFRQLVQLQKIYKEIHRKAKTDAITINTRMVDFCECIVNVNSFTNNKSSKYPSK
jgi:hypothetical protein